MTRHTIAVIILGAQVIDAGPHTPLQGPEALSSNRRRLQIVFCVVTAFVFHGHRFAGRPKASQGDLRRCHSIKRAPSSYTQCFSAKIATEYDQASCSWPGTSTAAFLSPKLLFSGGPGTPSTMASLPPFFSAEHSSWACSGCGCAEEQEDRWWRQETRLFESKAYALVFVRHKLVARENRF